MPDLADFVAKYAKPYDPETDTYRRPPFASPVKAGKATAIYNAHSYHTKVPPQGIEPYIAHYTDLGDLMLDPFCGSGMTGVAALKLGRRVILNDLSPAAAHIAYNYCTPVNVNALKREFERIKAAVKDEMNWLYGTTCDRCGGPATILHTVWSDIFECGRCGNEIVLWEVAVDLENGRVHESFSCSNCAKEWRRAQLRLARVSPAMTVYECQHCRPKRSQHPVTPAEIDRITEVESGEIPYWYPREMLDPEWEMYIRGALQRRRIVSVDQFYTRRNLRALSRLWHEFRSAQDTRISRALEFVFTSALVRATIMTRYNMGKAGNAPMSGLLYIPSLTTENNILLLMCRKFDDVANGLSEVAIADGYCGLLGSATSLPQELKGVVDYVFTDPPFGQNLYYADLNFIWESWLGAFTNRSFEAVVHREQTKEAKDIQEYARLMTGSFREMYRVLKPGRWASVVFHNSDDRVWQTIIDAARDAGLELAEINSFDKEQLSYKGILGQKGVERVTNKDIVLNLRKPTASFARPANGTAAARNGDAEARVVQRIADYLATNPGLNERTLQHFWNVVLHKMLSNGAVEVSMEQVGDMLPHYFKQVDGRWYLRGEAVLGGNVFDLKSDAGALAWLTSVLNEPQTTGDLIPKWQSATAQAGEVDPGRLERLLKQNFWLDKKTGRWRLPTKAERQKMSGAQDVSAEAHLRVIRRFLAGQSDLGPSNRELAEWVRFAYHHEVYAEAVALYAHVDESQLEPEYVKALRKIVAVCRLKAGQAEK